MSLWYKNAVFFRLNTGTHPIDFDTLAERLAARPFTPCNGLDWESSGFVPPFKFAADTMLMQEQGRALLTLRRDDKVLPVAIINEALAAKVEEIESTELRTVGRKEKLELKEQITDDLLPRAFTKASRTSAYIDPAAGWIVVNASSANNAEKLISTIRDTLPPFPAAIPHTTIGPIAAMTAWLLDAQAPEGFEFDSTIKLEDGTENGTEITIKNGDLTSDEVRQLLEQGRQVTQMGLIWRERVRFTLTDSLHLKSIQFLDVLQEEASQKGDDVESLARATFTLMTEELTTLIDTLIATMGGLAEDQQPDRPPQETHPATEQESPWAA